MILDEFDKLRKNLKVDDDGKNLLKEFRKSLKRSEAVSEKYGRFYDRVMSDGLSPEEIAQEMNLK